jgi:hypothetical protein
LFGWWANWCSWDKQIISGNEKWWMISATGAYSVL